MHEIHCITTGRVQMVGYRYAMQREASRIGISGYVRNLPDGTVETVAQGEREALERFIAALRRGPFFSRVDDVRVEWREPCERLIGFRIAY